MNRINQILNTSDSKLNEYYGLGIKTQILLPKVPDDFDFIILLSREVSMLRMLYVLQRVRAGGFLLLDVSRKSQGSVHMFIDILENLIKCSYIIQKDKRGHFILITRQENQI